MLKGKLYITAMFALAVSVAGCKKGWLDANEDPETTTSVEPEFLMYGAQTAYSTNRTTEIGLSGAMWSQLWASGQSAGVFLNPERYIISNFTTGNTWRNHFPTSQSNLNFAIDLAENPERGNPKPNMAAQAKVMRVLIYYTTTILFGDVPYSEALNDEIDFPKFDSQEDVLNGLLGELDAALTQFDDSPDATKPELVIDDHYYGGNITNWIAFAKSLKFRILMGMVDADPSKQSDIQQMLAEGGMISSNAQSALFDFYDESGHRNPNFGLLRNFGGGRNLFYYASEVMVETMKKYGDPGVIESDPRMALYFRPGDDTTGIKGVFPGEDGKNVGTPGSTDAVDAVISLNVVNADAPERVYTYTEQLLLEAEAEYRFGSVANGDTKLRAAIRNSMEYWGVASADIDTYLANIPNLASLTNGEAIQLIAEQAWIAYIDKPIEAWTTWRRLEFPALLQPSGARFGNPMRRLPYPPDEVSSNPNAPTPIPVDVKMWFDQ